MSDILTRDDINVTLVEETLWVGSIPASELQASAWPLLKCMFAEHGAGDRPGFFSLTQEEDGLTLIMDDRCHDFFAEAAEAGVCNVVYAPHCWRAFEVHLGQLVWEVPGVVCFLSTMMAESQISILNLSTHDRDFVLVSEFDVEPAIALIRDKLGGDVDELKAAISEMHERSHRSSAELAPLGGGPAPCGCPKGEACTCGAAEGSSSAEEGGGAVGAAEGLAECASKANGGGEGVALAETPCASTGRRFTHEAAEEGDSLYIKVLSQWLVVIRLQLQTLEPSTHALMKRLLFSPRRAKASFWAYTHTDDDVSLIIDEACLRDFPQGAILGSPAPWRAMKLTGRSFAFDETGVVSSMFAPYRERVPLLNVSTFATNVTLVEERELAAALAAFEDARMPCRLDPELEILDE